MPLKSGQNTAMFRHAAASGIIRQQTRSPDGV